PRENDPVGEGFDLALEFGVRSNLPVKVVAPAYFSEPTTHLLLNSDNGQCFIEDAQTEPLAEPLAGLQVTLQLGKVVCIKNQQFLSRRFAVAGTRDPAELPLQSLDRP